MVNEHSRPHAVAIPFPTQGHLSPLLHLCRALACRGFYITFINVESNQERMKKSFDSNHDIHFKTVPDILTVPLAEFDVFYKDNRVAFLQSVLDMEKPVEKVILDVIDNKEGPAVTCLISDLFFKWPRDVAKRLGVPNVTLWTATCASLVIDLHIPVLLDRGDIPVQDATSDEVITNLPGLSPLPKWAVPTVYRQECVSYDVGFVKRYNRTKDLTQDSWVLINSFEEIERAELEALREFNANSVAVGPLLLCGTDASAIKERVSNPSLWKEDEECLTWLERQKPGSVLYISFGSLAKLEFDQFQEFLSGLEELKRPFIWAIRPNSVYDMQDVLFEEFVKKISEEGFGQVVSWAPQLEVLMHSSTGGFLTHCGWNSVMEGISAGVPMICYPRAAEQNLNCKLVTQDWKIGVRFEREGYVAKDEFVMVVKDFMDGGFEIRQNVKKIKEAAYKSVSVGGSSYNNLQRFIDDMT